MARENPEVFVYATFDGCHLSQASTERIICASGVWFVRTTRPSSVKGYVASSRNVALRVWPLLDEKCVFVALLCVKRPVYRLVCEWALTQPE